MGTSRAALAAQRAGLALILAAFRRDHEAVVRLLQSATPQEMTDIAVFCAQFAAEKCHEQEAASPGLDLDLGLRTVALELAARPQEP